MKAFKKTIQSQAPMVSSLMLGFLLLALFPCGLCIKPQNIIERDNILGPALQADFPDPSIIWVESENLWFAFATYASAKNVQVATSRDFIDWMLTGEDALPIVGGWTYSSSPQVWAPMVIQIPDGSFVMYYTANSEENTAGHCAGVATSRTARGPYIAQVTPFVCHLDRGSVLDPAGHLHPDGSLYVIYTIDNSNSTRFVLQQVALDGFTKIGDEVPILDRNHTISPKLAAPSLIHVGGVWFLFYSTGSNKAMEFDLTYATANALTGPYVEAKLQLLHTGLAGLRAPGSACFVANGTEMAFDAWLGALYTDGRGMWTGVPTISGTNVTLTLTTASNAVPRPPRPPITIERPAPTGDIVGGIIGGVALIAIMILVAVFVWRRRRSIQAHDAQRTTPFLSQLPNNPLITSSSLHPTATHPHVPKPAAPDARPPPTPAAAASHSEVNGQGSHQMPNSYATGEVHPPKYSP